jgi:arsenate reductase
MKKSNVTIYHNNRCSTSRSALDILHQHKIEPTIIHYLEGVTIEQIKDLLQLLNCKPIDMMRQKEPIFISEIKDKKLTNLQLIKAMVKYPILIERPIVIKNGKAIIARPFERLNEFIK